MWEARLCDMSDILLHFQHCEDTCGSLKHEELSSTNEEGSNMLSNDFQTFWWICTHRRSSFFFNDRRSKTNHMFQLALVSDHLVSMVGSYASCLNLNLSSECRLSDKILSFKRRRHYHGPSLVLFVILFSNTKFWLRQYTRSKYHDEVCSNRVSYHVTDGI